MWLYLVSSTCGYNPSELRCRALWWWGNNPKRLHRIPNVGALYLGSLARYDWLDTGVKSISFHMALQRHVRGSGSLLVSHSVWRIVYGHLTHWGLVTHLCVSKLTILISDNGLSSGRRQAIIWTNVGILLIGTLKTNFSEIHTLSFTKIHFKMSSAKWQQLVPVPIY